MKIDKEKIKLGLEKTKHLEELDKALSTAQELESEDKEFLKLAKQLRSYINADFDQNKIDDKE